MRGEVWLADALALLRRPDLSAADRDVLLGLLGFRITPAEAPPGVLPARSDGTHRFGAAAEHESDADLELEPRPPAPGAPVPAEDVRTSGDTVSPHLRELSPVVSEPPPRRDWADVPSLEPPSHRTIELPLEPLLAPRSAAAILHLLLSTPGEDGPVDVSPLVGALARRQHVDRLPRRTAWRVRYGTELLVDIGKGMEPFRPDTAQLATRVTALAGDRVTVRYFADCPMRGVGGGPRRSWTPYRPLHSRSRVLVVSNFGLGVLPDSRDSGAPEWTAFFSVVAESGCSPVALLPYPLDRCPGFVRRWAPVVSWDRTTTVPSTATGLRRGRTRRPPR